MFCFVSAAPLHKSNWGTTTYVESDQRSEIGDFPRLRNARLLSNQDG